MLASSCRRKEKNKNGKFSNMFEVQFSGMSEEKIRKKAEMSVVVFLSDLIPDHRRTRQP